jgi:chitin disaccharide deacetylase
MKIRPKIIFVIICLSMLILSTYLFLNRDGQIRLIVRGDDMGFSHEVNVACIKAYQQGILTSVEVMVPCDYFLEAVEMLKENPGLDVGIHLTLNSEWENIKWGPITNAPSLVDENGYFFPMTWPDEAYSPDKALGTADWKIEEIEKELRAQIETALQHLPMCSHATAHMGFNSISPQINNLAFRLVREYNVDANIRMLPLKQVSLFDETFTVEDMVTNAIEVLENLGPGTWEFYEHPGLLVKGKEAHWHIGAEDDARYRDAVTKALTDDRLKQVIKTRKIKLIGYNDLKFWH